MRQFLLILFLLLSFATFSQEGLKRSEYEFTPVKGIVYFNEFAMSLQMNTNGFSLGLNKGRIAKYYLTKYYHFDLAYNRSPKERRKSTYLPGFEGFSSYTFGKQNEFFLARAGLGRKYYLSEKGRKRGVAIGYSIEGGLDVAILKPYYLVLKYVNELDQELREEAYSPENAHLFLDITKIRNKGSFYKGWDELKFLPGIYLKTAAHFSLGAYDKYIRALEVGIQLDAFIDRVPIMVESEDFKNDFLFPSLFVNLQFGKRWR